MQCAMFCLYLWWPPLDFDQSYCRKVICTQQNRVWVIYHHIYITRGKRSGFRLKEQGQSFVHIWEFRRHFSAIDCHAVTAAFYKVYRVSFAKGPGRKGGKDQLRPKATWKTGDQGRGSEESKMLYWLAQIMGKNNS